MVDHCPACAHVAAAPLLDDRQPLATLAWPRSEAAARAMPALPLDFVRCVDCGHVYNRAFSYDAVPYGDQPNRMFNAGVGWSGFVRRLVGRALDGLPEAPTVVEIGYGDGHFLAALAAARPGGRYVGFDPHGAQAADDALELRAALFEPASHLPELRPDLIVARHVLEHLESPLALLQRVEAAAVAHDLRPLGLLEVPCVDRLWATGRTVDLFYEHVSHFTTASFGRMLARSGAEVMAVEHGYDGEVVFGLARFGVSSQQRDHAAEAAAWRAAAAAALPTIRAQLDELAGAVVWGGTGKAAAFLNRYGLDAARFPLVVDSDPAKVGTFVPGTGQRIASRDALRGRPDAVVIVPSQWRAADIVAEMAAAGLTARQVLIEHAGRLIDFARDPHPYTREVE
ncbi:MAG: methyltransferase domain-containing protein [Myxococcales bacterium]|nr:methyltransferase domain-containing protein [Myxococcales bacterium]